MLEIEEFDEEIVEALRNRAKDVLVTKAIASEEKLDKAKPADDLLNMQGMDTSFSAYFSKSWHCNAGRFSRAGC